MNETTRDDGKRFWPGDRLIAVDEDNQREGKPREITVVKIGRTWIWCKDNGNQVRVDPDELNIDDPRYGHIGQCFPSWDAYHLHREWQEFRFQIQRNSEEIGLQITLTRLRDAARALGISLEKEKGD